MGDREGRDGRRVLAVLEKINSNKNIPEVNKRQVQEWVEFLKARGIAEKTIEKHLYCFERFLVLLPKGITLKKATRENIQTVVAKIEGSEYAPETKHVIKVIIKAFYKHYKGDDEFYPKEVSWMKTSFSKNKRKLPEDMLSEEEILKMIKTATNPRDKAIIALLYDSGIRVGELLNLKIKNIDLDKEPAHVLVDGKTGMRKIPILFSAPYLASFYETVRAKKPDDFLLTAMGTWSNMNWRLDEAGVRKVLRETAKKAGIEKRVYPHLFRHSRATYYANRLTEQQLKAFFGWTGASKMASNYVHLSGRDIDDAVLQAYGKIPKEVMAPKLVEKVCSRCRYANGIDFLHCQRCGAPLDATNVLKGAHETEALKDAMLEMIQDPDFHKDMLRYLKESGKKGKE